MKLWTDSKLGKKYVKAVYCHSAYLPFMQSILCRMLGWVKHKLEPRLPGEISMTQVCRWHNLYGRKRRESKELHDESERGEWKKTALQLSIQKAKIMASGSITSWHMDRETMETVRDIIFSSVRSVTQFSNSLRPHESQHARPPCPSPTPGIYSNSRL